MYRVRTIKTTSGATAVQVVEYFKNQREILLHLDSASSEEELYQLLHLTIHLNEIFLRIKFK